MKEDHIYLEFILECIQKILEYTAEGKAGFMGSTLVQDGVLRNLHTMTESSQRLSQHIKEANPTVDWRALSGFRNILVHDYMGIDMEAIWDILERRLPLFQKEVERILNEPRTESKKT